MRFAITTWNINSVRLRFPLVKRFLLKHAPDVLCLQETKCPDDKFPRKDFEKIGYPHIAIYGQKGYHGVATISRHPIGEGHPVPAPVAKGRPGRRDGAVDVGLGPVRHASHKLARGRAVDLDPATARRDRGLAVDQHRIVNGDLDNHGDELLAGGALRTGRGPRPRV